MRLINADEIRIKPEYMHDICGVAMIRVEDIARILNDMPTIEPEPHWTPFQVRELTDEERERYPDWGWILDGDVPEDGQEILVSRGNWVTTDTFLDEGECYLDGGWEIEEGMAWMPLPEPYQPEEETE